MPSGFADTDPIEAIRGHWVAQDLGDPRKFLAMGSLLRLHSLMTDKVDRTLKEFGLNRNSYLMLSTVMLSSHGSRLLSHIANHMLVHPTTVTLLADKLEEMSLLTRQPHPTDRRATFAEITPAGRALMKDATRALEEIDYGLPGLTARQAHDLTSSVAAIRQAAGDGH